MKCGIRAGSRAPSPPLSVLASWHRSLRQECRAEGFCPYALNMRPTGTDRAACVAQISVIRAARIPARRDRISDRKSVVQRKSLYDRVVVGGDRNFKKKNNQKRHINM